MESGEQTGMLKDTFQALADELRMQEDLKRKVIGAITYPVVILVFLIIVLTIVMVYVIPQILPIIREMTTEIPFSTRTLIGTSDFIRNYIWLLLILV